MSKKDREKTRRSTPETTTPSETEVQKPKLTPATIACGGCAIVFVICAIIGIVAVTVWDSNDGRLYEGKPLPENVGYIGRWVSDGEISARIDTFAIAGSTIACDFAIRNDTASEITVHAIGRTIIAQSIDSLFTYVKIPLALVEDDEPMQVVDEKNAYGLTSAYGQMALVIPEEAEEAPVPDPFTLGPGEVKRLRYRPNVHPLLMPALALRLAVQVDDGREPHAFYFMRKSAGIGGWFERGAEKAIQTAQ